MRQIYHSCFIVIGEEDDSPVRLPAVYQYKHMWARKVGQVRNGVADQPQERLNARICACMCVRGGEGKRGQERDDVQPRTQPFATSVASPSRHPPRPALGDRLNRAPSSCALSSPRPATRPSSGALDGIRRRPVTLGTRSASFPSPARSSAPNVQTYTLTRRHGYREKLHT